MSTKAVVTCLFLASGLALAGCSDDSGIQEATAAARSSAPSSPAGTAPDPSSEPSAGPSAERTAEPAEESGPAPAEPGAADPWTAFSATPEGRQHAGTVSGIEQQPAQEGGLLHRLTADVNDRSVAVDICRAYQSAMGTGQDRIDVVDTAGQLLASATGDPRTCRVEVNTGVGAVPFPEKFTYDEALAAWQNGVPYYDAFCLNYEPVTAAGAAQCAGIENGTVNSVTGEYIGG